MPDDPTGFDDEVFAAAYEELRRLAYALRKGRDLPTLNPTALVHEAYIKLAGSKQFRAASPQHLKFTLVKAMKYVLLDAARRKATESRGGGLVRISLDDPSAAAVGIDPAAVIAVGGALDALERTNQQQARAFELQFFGGLEVAEIAMLLEVSEKKAQRLLRFARAALAVLLADAPPGRSAAG